MTSQISSFSVLSQIPSYNQHLLEKNIQYKKGHG